MVPAMDPGRVGIVAPAGALAIWPQSDDASYGTRAELEQMLD